MEKIGFGWKEFEMTLNIDDDIIEVKDILTTRNGYKILITYINPYLVEYASHPYWLVKGKLISKYPYCFIPEVEIEMISLGYYDIDRRSKKLAKILKNIYKN